jgi:thiol-disulfide isomerase/thioredoxin
MRTFDTQLDFEQYWFDKAEVTKPAGCRAEDKAFFVYFTASWCGPCRRLDLDAIEAAAKATGIPIWKVEQTVNDYTAGYCDVRSLPTFILAKPKEIVSRVSSSSTLDVVTWMSQFPKIPSGLTKK